MSRYWSGRLFVDVTPGELLENMKRSFPGFNFRIGENESEGVVYVVGRRASGPHVRLSFYDDEPGQVRVKVSLLPEQVGTEGARAAGDSAIAEMRQFLSGLGRLDERTSR